MAVPVVNKNVGAWLYVLYVHVASVMARVRATV